MAAITITRGFTDYPDSTPLLVPVHLPTSIEFEFDRGAISGSYVEVVINSVAFRATKILTVGNVDTYQLNGDMLKYLLGIPDLDSFELDRLTLECTVVCNGYNSAGSVIATATDTTFYLCHAISALTVDGLLELYQKGRTSTGNIYFTRWLYYFDEATKKITRAYDPPTGVYDTGTYSINIVNVPELTENVISIAWLNSDGCYDRFDFTVVTTERQSKKSNPINLYANQLFEWKGNEQNITNDVEETLQLKTIALNSEHYEQMYFISQSMLIMDAQSGQLFELSSPPAPISACKQNLNFTFTLKRKIHGQSY